MPIKRAALRQLRKDRKRSVRNQAIESELKTLKKHFLSLVSQKPAEATEFLSTVMRRFDQAAARGLIHKNTASRTKSRLTKTLTRKS